MNRLGFAVALVACLACNHALGQGAVYTFTSGGATANVGPDQAAMDAAYLGTTLEGTVTVNGGIQEWVVPVQGRYRIEAFGGQGWGDFGGRGAHISGDFTLDGGETLRILVGQMAGPYLDFPGTTYNHQFGGGGGSFVMLTSDADLNNDVPMIVAGGGGGNHGVDYVVEADGQTGTAGAAGVNGSTVGAGGIDGNGGQDASSADGGGGWLTSGTGIAAGQAYVIGGLGGIDEGTGGFGGGGGTSSWNNYRGGGGGGYSGGGGGNNSSVCCPAGGGGGSFNAGENPVNLAGVQLGDGMVVITTIEGPPLFTKQFTPETIAPGGISTLSFALDSSFNLMQLTDLDFTDSLPAGMVIATPANASSTCNGTLTANEGGTEISLADGVIDPFQSCAISVDVSVGAEGFYDNVSGNLNSSLGVNPVPATATLTVTSPPLFGKTFSPNQAAPGEVVSLSFALDNSANPLDASAANFLDVFPSGMVVASPANLSSDCGGTLSANEGGDSVELVNGLIAAGASCTIEVDVSSAAMGSYENISGALTSSLGDSGTASDTLIVAAPEIVLSEASLSGTALIGGQVQVTFDIENQGQADLDWSIDTAGPFAIAPMGTTPVQIYDNGPFVTSVGDGPGGADVSLVQNVTLGLTTLGAAVQLDAPGPHNRLADDFSVAAAEGWDVRSIRLFGYQTGSTTTSSFTGVNLQIWDGEPGVPGSNVVFGDTSTNRIVGTGWTGAYRYFEDNIGVGRPIMFIDASVEVVLPPGSYWLDWQLAGSIASGPWNPSITVLGQAATGDARQLLGGGWGPFLDAGAGTPAQGAPFVISGVDDACDAPSAVDWLSVSAVNGTTAPGGSDTVTVTMDAASLGQGTYQAKVCVFSNDPLRPLVSLPVSFEVTRMPQSIGFDVLSDRPFGQPPFNVAATASSGLPVSFASQTGAVCSVVGDEVSLLAVGTCSIEATQAGDATYLPATPVVRSFEVLGADVVVSPGSLPSGTIFTLYSANFTASGAGTTEPFGYAVTAGALPAGLQLASSGALTGTPTETGVFQFTVTATDSTDPGIGGPFSGSQDYNLVIEEVFIFFDGFEDLLPLAREGIGN